MDCHVTSMVLQWWFHGGIPGSMHVHGAFMNLNGAFMVPPRCFHELPRCLQDASVGFHAASVMLWWTLTSGVQAEPLTFSPPPYCLDDAWMDFYRLVQAECPNFPPPPFPFASSTRMPHVWYHTDPHVRWNKLPAPDFNNIILDKRQAQQC